MGWSCENKLDMKNWLRKPRKWRGNGGEEDRNCDVGLH